MTARQLLADVGGTTTRLALGGADGRIEALERHPSPRQDLLPLLRSYRERQGSELRGATIAAAGRVRRLPGRARVTLTNLALNLSREELSAGLDLPVQLLNDLAAVAAALPHLPARELERFGPDRQPGQGTRVVVGLGTGFGCAVLTADGAVLETEAGHADLPAATAEERACLNRLSPLRAVSIESLFSGPGVLRHHALCTGEELDDPGQLHSRTKADPRSAKAMRQYSRWLGRVCGNLVLSHGAWGGLYLTGGVAAGLGILLDAASFREGFEDKPHFGPELAAVPAWRIRTEEPALLGLARLAL